MSTVTPSNVESPQAMLAAIRAPIQADLAAADDFILQQLASNVTLVQEVTKHIIRSGGKRLRPLLVLLSARALGYKGDQEHLELATIIEFVHTATLLHDDVIDGSKLRRNRKTANAVWGNAASVLSGDFLYSRAFQILASRNNKAVMQTLADTTNAIAEGEILQLMNCHDADITEARYFDVITAKTAKLFAASGQIGALICDSTVEQQQAMYDYGLHIGFAFQIIDDLLDYIADPEQTGKNIGDDLNEGKCTLPLIHALAHCDSQTATVIRQAIETGNTDAIDTVIDAIHATDAKAYCLQKTQQHLDLAAAALNALPASRYRSALNQLLHFVIHRNF